MTKEVDIPCDIPTAVCCVKFPNIRMSEAAHLCSSI